MPLPTVSICVARECFHSLIYYNNSCYLRIFAGKLFAYHLWFLIFPTWLHEISLKNRSQVLYWTAEKIHFLTWVGKSCVKYCSWTETQLIHLPCTCQRYNNNCLLIVSPFCLCMRGLETTRNGITLHRNVN